MGMEKFLAIHSMAIYNTKSHDLLDYLNKLYDSLNILCNLHVHSSMNHHIIGWLGGDCALSKIRQYMLPRSQYHSLRFGRNSAKSALLSC